MKEATTIGRFLEHCGATIPLDEYREEELKKAIAYSIQTAMQEQAAPGRRFNVLAGKLDSVDRSLDITVYSTDCSVHDHRYVEAAFNVTYMRWSDKHGNEGLLFGKVIPANAGSAEILGVQILGLDAHLAGKAVKYKF